MIPTWATELMRSSRSRLRGNDIILQRCPYCGNMNWNCEVSISKCLMHCWVCNMGKFATKFLFEQGIQFDRDSIKPTVERKDFAGIASLPASQPLLNNDSRVARRAVAYLQTRDMTRLDIEQWHMQIGTGDDKDAVGFNYFGFILVPQYGFSGMEYFIGINQALNNKYHLPDGGKDHFVPKKRGSSSIVLCEGIFDGTSLWKYTDLDVMMLFGKFLGPYQFDMLVKSNYERVYVCLDNDAVKEAGALAEQLYRAGAKPYLVKLPFDSDPNELGSAVTKYIHEAAPFGMTSRSKLRRDLIMENI